MERVFPHDTDAEWVILRGMGILIGMDEAGYGPNLGPLVVAATAWQVPAALSGDGSAGRFRWRRSRDGEVGAEQVASAAGRTEGALASRSVTCCSESEVDLYGVLRDVVASRAGERRIAIADSKSLYHRGNGLRNLELGIHAVLRAIGQPCGSWTELVEGCRADPERHYLSHSWPDGIDYKLPLDAVPDEVAEAGDRFARACVAAGIRPLVIRARLVFPEQFNELVAYYGTKGAVLSDVTVGLLREVMEMVHWSGALTSAAPLEDEARPFGLTSHSAPISFPQTMDVVCDKHGGRNFYAALLQHHFPESWVEPVHESRAASRYEWGPPEARVRVIFRTNGETFLPTALASMTAKYLRELAMRAFNEFWCARVPNLRPTAGYAGDSRRFKQAITAKQRELGIADRLLWRER